MIYYHYAELVHRQAEKYGSRTALKYRDNATGKWLKISWKEFSEKVMLTAKAMARIRDRSTGNIGVYSQNMRNAFIRFWGICEPCGFYSDVCNEFSGADRVYNQ